MEGKFQAHFRHMNFYIADSFSSFFAENATKIFGFASATDSAENQFLEKWFL